MSASAPLSQAMIDVLNERRRQIAIEGFDEAHDDEHNRGEIAAAAAAYAFAASVNDFDRQQLNQPHSHLRWLLGSIWPRSWDLDRWFKLKTKRQDLVRSAALTIAAIERIDRAEAKVAIPVDRSQRQLAGGGPVTDDHREIEPSSGQQKGYVVLTEAERAKGFQRPYRDAYRHATCGKITTMGRDIAETYARDPFFYSGTFCSTCRAHFPVGEDGEFTWYEMDGREGPKVGT